MTREAMVVRRVGAAIAVLIASLAVGMAPVAADNGNDAAGTLRAQATKTVVGDLVISSERDPRDARRCSVKVYYEFDDHPGTTSAEVTYTYQGEEHTRISLAKYGFDDYDNSSNPVRIAPPGRHRIKVGGIIVVDDGDTDSCNQSYVPRFQADYSPTGSIELTTDQEGCELPGSPDAPPTDDCKPKLTLELKTYSSEGGNAVFTSFPPSAGVDPDEADETTVLGVTLRNDGNGPLDGAQVRGLTTKVIKSRCKGNPLAPARGGPLGTPTTLQPGQERLELYKFTERCPGQVKATVRATAAGGEEETADTLIEVPDNAYIVGQLTVAPTLYGSLEPFEYQRLAENLRIRAVGKKRTLTTTSIDENRRFSIKVPNRALGRYQLSVTGNKVTEALPGRVAVTAVRGKSVEASGFELGYNCNEAPFGLDFVPDRHGYDVPAVGAGRGPRLILGYKCRTQRVEFLQLDIFDEAPEPDAFEFDECESSDGSTYPAYYVFPLAESRLPLDGGEFELSILTGSDAGSAGSDLRPATVRGVFTHPGGGTLTVTHPECDFLNFEADFD